MSNANDSTILDGGQYAEAAEATEATEATYPVEQPAAPVNVADGLGADINSMAVQSEEMPSLVDYGREPSTGAWPDGWYAATILPGYASQNGFQWNTEDTLSKDGNSRNLRVCFALKNKAGETRNYFSSFNYRLFDFSNARLKAITDGRKYAIEQKWPKRWPGDWADVQRSSLATSQLGQFERALGFRLKLIPGTGLNASIFPGHQLDLRLKANDETGYSDVIEFGKLGERKSLYR